MTKFICTLAASISILVPLTVFGTQCGSGGSTQERKNLVANRGPVVIDGAVRYGNTDGCVGKGNLAAFRYHPKQNLISLYHCTGGVVFFAEEDNDGYVCENLGPAHLEDPNKVVARAIRQYGNRYVRRSGKSHGKHSGAQCVSDNQCASGACIPLIVAVGPYVCE